MAAAYEDVSDSDEEEEECRVCRGPAEEGRPLYKPCKCSGSIGLTHQDCLTSWLEVTRGDGRCELCSTQFQFAPEYAAGTPDRLSAREVGFRILRRLAARWLPRGLRAAFAAALWLIVLPLCTSYIYHGWMHRPSAVAQRWSWELAKRDTVGGAVIAIIIVVSFLSLMSFAEFLRFQWGGAQRPGGAAGERRGNRANNREGRGGAIEGDIDDIIVHHDDADPLGPFVNRLRVGDEGSVDRDADEESLTDHAEEEEKSMDGGDRDLGNDNNVHAINEVLVPLNNDQAEEEEDNEDPLQPAFEDEEDELEAFMREQEEQEMDNPNIDAPAMPPPAAPVRNRPEDPALVDVPDLPPAGNRRPNRRPRDDARFEPQFEPLQPAFADMDAQDDGGEVEINVAIDELLGFRGPLLALVRNLLWLLVFNTAYLGVFAFAPTKFGGVIYRVLAKVVALLPISGSIPESLAGVGQVWQGFLASMQELDRKSRDTNHIYQPTHLAKLGLGYVSFFIGIFLMKSAVTFALRSRSVAPPGAAAARRDDRIRGRRAQRDDLRENVLRAREQEEAQNDEGNQLAWKFSGFLEVAAAIAKVVVLLFIKMLFLPLMLGIWLDLATLSLFEKSWSDRIDYAGADLFGATFLHWVVGITFMLLVTVSVLQLREVAHPDILSRVIRPQEPQPDLLGNLLQESGSTHTKRVLLSLAIYAALLGIHIWLPARLLLMSNMGQYMPLFKPKFWHFMMPTIQVPLELFVFHLCMLGVLEKYKNKIGECQHHWLLFMGRHLAMTNQILPREVDHFSLVGTLPVFKDDVPPMQLEDAFWALRKIQFSSLDQGVLPKTNDALHPLWNCLLSENDATKREKAIQTSLQWAEEPESPETINGITQRNGKRVLSTHAYIRMPSESPPSRLVVKTSDDAGSYLLHTAIGPYRLRQGVLRTPTGTVTGIEIWHEVAGKPIPRPPEGWDDLGVGGAERHGRWAWGDEHLSEIENSVAARTAFFEDIHATKWANTRTTLQLAAKMAFLLFVSWFAISVILCAVINIPLHTGHFAFYLLRVPEGCLHDPFAFGMGVLLLVPVAGTSFKMFAASNNGLIGALFLPVRWVRSFKPHQTPEKVKTLSIFFVLWLFVCPVLLGFVYCSFISGIGNGIGDVGASSINWGTGTLLLNMWAIMCYYKMFTKRFWAEIVMGEGQANAEENQDAGPGGARQGGENPAANAGVQGNDDPVVDADDVTKRKWQGEDGSIARALQSVKAFASGWEWDKVDKQLLLQDCTLIITSHLVIWCAVPTAALAFVAPLTKAMGSQIGLTAIFRIFTVAGVVADLLYSSKKSLQRWFQAAHKIARDDAYLIGVRLQNYRATTTNT